MTGFPLEVFVSSSCYELRDLRAAIRDWLTARGVVPMMSEATVFSHVDGMPPQGRCAGRAR
jgi:hypothetical protein